MRRSYDEILKGIEERSKKGIKQRQTKRKAFYVTAVSLLLVAAICAGFAFRPAAPDTKAPVDVTETNSSAEISYPNYSDVLENGNYLPIQQLSADLMEGITANDVSSKPLDGEFLTAYADFSMKLFGSLYADCKNALVSPLSAVYALAMLANGAEGETKAQIESALGGMDTETLNAYMHYLSDYLQGKEVNIANSVWVTDSERFMVNPDFLQTNADYYSAGLYKAAFDNQTVNDVNGWVKEKTKGMIEKIVDEYSGDEVMQLINALCFEAEWVWKTQTGWKSTFHNADGSETETDFMFFNQEKKYLKTENATGVIKDYKGGKYSFVALMPNEGISINDYIAALDGKAFMSAISNVVEGDNIKVQLTMPKFKYNVSMDLIPTLEALGMKDAFDPGKANLTGLGVSTAGNVFVSSATQDTFIEVSELGTKAAAVTSMIISDDAMYETYYIDLDRPFVYAIVDTATGLPLFTGAVTTFE